VETAAPWKPWKTNGVFSTVPTALGKLGSRRRVPTVPTASAAGYIVRERKQLSERLLKIEVDKMLVKA
jgi:hypothetical protein